MRKKLEELILNEVRSLYGLELEKITISVPEEKFGDYASSVAMSIAGTLKKPPQEIADKLASILRGNDLFSSVEVVQPGFINMTLTNEALWQRATEALGPSEALVHLKNQNIIIEYSDPNPFKVLHVGHLYTSLYGRSLVNLLSFAGAEVSSLNFGGDIGMHVAKTLWSIISTIGGEHPEKLNDVPQGERSRWMTNAYIEGNNIFEESKEVKAEIEDLNKKIYAIHKTNDRKTNLAKIYWTCREWSYTYFEEFYARLGIKFDKYYPESSVAQLGVDTVLEQLDKGVFEESDGAVVYRGENRGLHTRVFINAQGLPTYEAKDVGLILAKERDYQPDLSIIDTGNEQLQYLEVVLAAVSEFRPELVKKTRHITHGTVKLKGGVKMSSRKGNILEATEVIDSVSQELETDSESIKEALALGAITYGLLKTKAGSDILFDARQSVASRGNSGVYLQYTHARLASVISQSKADKSFKPNFDFDQQERTIVRELAGFSEAVENSIIDLSPHHLCAYLYELAQKTNHFYEQNRIVGNAREDTRIAIIEQIVEQLKTGLKLLGIAAPNRV